MGETNPSFMKWGREHRDNGNKKKQRQSLNIKRNEKPNDEYGKLERKKR